MRPEIVRLVQDLAAERYQALESDGRAGRLDATQLSEAVSEYGRTLVELPDSVWRLVDEYPIDGHPDELALDIPLWTAEEGRSDLTLSVTACRTDGRITLMIDDLHVL